VQFGIIYNTGQLGVDPSRIIAVARHAEDCGFESFFLPEHIALYPGATLGAYPVPPDLPLADPLSTLSFVAAATRRILLGTSVLLLPFHHPVILAKELATIDVLSGGRMRLLTVGLGVLPGEAGAVGVDFGTRGRRADEAIDVLRLLWAGGAEAMMIMDQRVLTTSAVRCIGNTLLLQGRTYSPPFVVTGIGDAAAMSSALDAEPGVRLLVQYVDKYKLGYDVTALDSVELPAYSGPVRLTSARQGGG